MKHLPGSAGNRVGGVEIRLGLSPLAKLRQGVRRIGVIRQRDRTNGAALLTRPDQHAVPPQGIGQVVANLNGRLHIRRMTALFGALDKGFQGQRVPACETLAVHGQAALGAKRFEFFHRRHHKIDGLVDIELELGGDDLNRRLIDQQMAKFERRRCRQRPYQPCGTQLVRTQRLCQRVVIVKIKRALALLIVYRR